ncbi:polyamine aminopropyltransferase [Uliginosibacterium sediminicola]|uniref:Polyamine aminopropyltransferase n=1 Tax=Uliginosibacterium sediminicola TaxID=2024550 RepID=A0ABU9YYL3_9RHOO
MFADRILILSVFVVASCGLAYELIVGALSSYLLGDSILQYSSIIGCYLFAMGVGSHVSKYVRDEDTVSRFVEIELLVGLIGGVSASVLFLVFAWLASPFRTVLYALVFLIGMLVGMEIPLVMRIFNERRAEFREMVSRVLTFDYLGALAVSLLFPLLLAPKLGLARTALLFGIANVLVALLTARHFREHIRSPRGVKLRGMAVLVLLLAAFVGAGRMTKLAEQGLFGDNIVHAVTTPYQRLVITQWKDDLRLYLNGNLQFSSLDEHRYHEALIHPAMQNLPAAHSVLVLGGGDGLAVRELLKYKQLEQITLVDLDAQMTTLFSSAARLTALNQHALTDTRVKVINADAAQWLENSYAQFDLIVIDLPDPSSYALGKLYSVPMYRLVSKHLAANGYIVVQSTSPWYAPHAFWCVVETLKAAGLHTWPYHAHVPSFGEWGYVLAAPHERFVIPTSYSIPMRFLDADTTRAMFSFPTDMQVPQVEANHLNDQVLVRYFEQDWGRMQH